MNNRGYTLIVSVMIISAILLGLAAATSRTLLSEQGASLDFEVSQQAQRLAEACADHALLELQNNPLWPGNANLALTGGTCTVDAVVFASPNILTTASTVDNRTYRLQIKFTTDPLTVTEWIRIP